MDTDSFTGNLSIFLVKFLTDLKLKWLMSLPPDDLLGQTVLLDVVWHGRPGQHHKMIADFLLIEDCIQARLNTLVGWGLQMFMKVLGLVS